MTALTYKIESTGHCETATRTRISVAGHEFFIDEPVERHGSNEGASPIEYLVSALVGCTNVISNRIAADMGLTLADMNIRAVAELDGDVLQQKQTEVAFPRVKLTVEGKSDASPGQIDELKERLALGCPVSVLFRQSGAEVEEEWRLTPL